MSTQVLPALLGSGPSPDLVSPLEENWAGRRVGKDLSGSEEASRIIFIVAGTLMVSVYGENL